MMRRRRFIKAVGAGSIGALAAKSNLLAATEEKRSGIHVGCQRGGTGTSNLEFLARHGVFHMDGDAPKFIEGVGWDLDDSLAKREACEKYGISLDAYHLPLSSAGIDRVPLPNIMLGKSPERDREIEMIQQMIEVAGKTGVHLLLYNTTIHKVLRTGQTVDPARGNARYSTWDYEKAVQMGMDKKLTSAGEVSIDEVYERITYLLDRILPVAEEYKVKLGNHIADPPLPVGFGGITRWNSPDVFEGIKRFAKLYDSPSHGFNLCLGSAAEGLKDPKTEILDIIRWVGARDQIFNIHLRNIKGGWGHFQEVYPDNGDMDFLEIVRTLKEVGFQGMLMPDHVPKHDAPGAILEGRAFAFGYFNALIHAVESEG